MKNIIKIFLFLIAFNTIGFSQTVVIFTTSTTFTVSGYATATVECWGGGGGGGGSSLSSGSSGGGGGGYSRSVMNIISGTTYIVNVGSGGVGGSGNGGNGGNTWFLSASTILAYGGGGGIVGGSVIGVKSISGIGTYTRTGGNGATVPNTCYGGSGGGGAGGSSGNGSNSNSPTGTGFSSIGSLGGVGGVNGGNGGTGATPISMSIGVNIGSNGQSPGGGGGGGSAASGGSGGSGQIKITYTLEPPLPIELLNFNVVFNGETTDITWETASEINNNYFTIERSTDGFNFSIIDTVLSKAINGNSTNILSYEISDNNSVSGIYYYRLKQTDYDGKFEYFNVVSISIYKKNIDKILIKVINLSGQEVDEDYIGFKVFIYSDGTYIKKIF